MAKMSREEFENFVMLFEKKKLRESRISLKFMDLFVANKHEEDLEEYAALADNEEYLKEINVGDGKTRKARDPKKIRNWFYEKYAPGYEFEQYVSSEKPKKTAAEKLAEKLNGLKF